MNTRTGLRVVGLAGLLAVGGAMSAGAAPISGAGSLGRFTGEVTYTATSDTKATLSVKLTNTSPQANGGYLTGFVPVPGVPPGKVPVNVTLSLPPSPKPRKRTSRAA